MAAFIILIMTWTAIFLVLKIKFYRDEKAEKTERAELVNWFQEQNKKHKKFITSEIGRNLIDVVENKNE